MIFVIRRVSSSRRLLRKRMYKAPHTRHKNATYYRENKNLVKSHQKEYKESHAPMKRKRRPRREVLSGFKMSYRYKYYADDVVDDEEIDEEEN